MLKKHQIKKIIKQMVPSSVYSNPQRKMLRETAKTGATGVELLAEQMIRRFPLPIETQEFPSKCKQAKKS